MCGEYKERYEELKECGDEACWSWLVQKRDDVGCVWLWKLTVSVVGVDNFASLLCWGLEMSWRGEEEVKFLRGL